MVDIVTAFLRIIKGYDDDVIISILFEFLLSIHNIIISIVFPSAPPVALGGFRVSILKPFFNDNITCKKNSGTAYGVPLLFVPLLRLNKKHF